MCSRHSLVEPARSQPPLPSNADRETKVSTLLGALALAVASIGVTLIANAERGISKLAVLLWFGSAATAALGFGLWLEWK
jgi:hypothetical protein